MTESGSFLKVFNLALFVILTGLGVLYLLAAPVKPLIAGVRIITGVVLIAVAIGLFVVISLVIQRKKVKVVKVVGVGTERLNTENIPSEIVCKNCDTVVELSDDYKKRNKVICENCGEELTIPKDNVNW